MMWIGVKISLKSLEGSEDFEEETIEETEELNEIKEDKENEDQERKLSALYKKELDYEKSLLYLGFKYLTRDLNGEIRAWKERPRRIIYYIDGYLKQVIERFGEKDTIYVSYDDDHLGDKAVVRVKDGVLYTSCFESKNREVKREYACIGIDDTELFNWLEWEDGIINIKTRISEVEKTL